MTKALIVVVNFNAGENLSRCMASLSNQTEMGFEVKVVDNASTDASLQFVPADKRFSIIHAGANIGFAAGCNLGANDTTAPFIVFLNPDAFPERNWLATLLRVAEKFPDAAMFGSLQLSAADPNIIDGAGDCYSCFGIPWRGGQHKLAPRLPAYAETFSPCGAAAMYRTKWFERAGGFDEKFFCFIEDVDLAYRLRLIGGRCLQVNIAIVHHVGGASAGIDSELTLYHGTRNRFWTVVKNTPSFLLWVIGLLHLSLTAYSIFRMRHMASTKAIKSGLRDGMADLPRVWKQRREIQASRTSSIGSIARMISWSFTEFRSHAIRLSPWQYPNSQ